MKKAWILALLMLTGCSYFESGEKSSWAVGILVADGVHSTDFVAPMDVFYKVADRGSIEVEVFLVGPSLGAIESAEGLKFRPQCSLADHPPIDVLVIPSFQDHESGPGAKRRILDWVESTAEEAQYVLSNGWGAYFPARVGLLEGREATTYPPDIGKFQQQFPEVKAVRGVVFVRDGKFITGAGGISSYDSALYVVEELWGEAIARSVADGLGKKWDLETVPYRIAKK